MALTKPTPPTPPTIDKGEATEYAPMIDAHKFFEIPFKRETINDIENEITTELEKNSVEKPIETPPPVHEKKVTTPEDMAREAVANGGGALTKKTITRPDAEINTPAPATSNLPLTTEKSNRGKEILREFQNEDRQTFQAVETPRNVKINQSESYSGFYWIGMLVFAGVLSFVFVKKFLIRKNPALKKSDLFGDADKRLQAVSEKISAPKLKTVEKLPVPNINSVEKVVTKKSPSKNDDDKGKHFEIRV